MVKARQATLSIGLIFLLSSCTYIRTQGEARRFKDTRYLIQESLPQEYIEQCGFNLNLPMPETTADKNIKFGYLENNKVTYPAYRPNSLNHEYTHYFTQNGFNGPISRECMEELTASYAARIDRLLRENRGLKLGMRR